MALLLPEFADIDLYSKKAALLNTGSLLRSLTTSTKPIIREMLSIIFITRLLLLILLVCQALATSD